MTLIPPPDGLETLLQLAENFEKEQDYEAAFVNYFDVLRATVSEHGTHNAAVQEEVSAELSTILTKALLGAERTRNLRKYRMEAAKQYRDREASKSTHHHRFSFTDRGPSAFNTHTKHNNNVSTHTSGTLPTTKTTTLPTTPTPASRDHLKDKQQQQQQQQQQQRQQKQQHQDKEKARQLKQDQERVRDELEQQQQLLQQLQLQQQHQEEARQQKRQQERARIQSLETECKTLRTQLSRQNVDSTKLQSEIENRKHMQSQRDQLEQELERVRTEIRNREDALKRVASESDARIHSLQTNLTKLSMEQTYMHERTQNRVNMLDSELKDKERLLLEARSAVVTKAKDIEQAEREIQLLKTSIDETKGSQVESLAAAETRIQALQTELQKSKQEVMDRKECICCYEEDSAEVAFSPCGHMCLCQDCAQLCKERIAENGSMDCYMCKTSATAVIRIFPS